MSSRSTSENACDVRTVTRFVKRFAQTRDKNVCLFFIPSKIDSVVG
jgi:hypothetical protein